MIKQRFEHAFREGGPRRTVNLLVRNGARRELAEELTDAAWARGWQNIWQLRNQGKLVAWINSIAMNMLRDEMHRLSLLRSLCSQHDRATAPWIDLNAIDARSILQRIRAPQQEILRRFYLLDEPAESIAKDLHISPASVYARVSRALRRIRKFLNAA